MKLTKQRLMEMAGLMTEEEQHLKMPFANNLPQGPKRIEWYGKHLAKMMTPADQEGPEGLLNALLDNPEDFPQNWRVAPEGELDYIESVADEIIAFANDYMDMPGFKGTKNALAGLSIREATVSGGDIEVTLTIPLQMFISAVEEQGYGVDPDLEASPNMLKQLAVTMEDDLQTWFERNGGEWLAEGLDENVYDDFLKR